MTSHISTAIFTALVVWWSSGFVLSWLYPKVRRFLITLHPEQASGLLLGWLSLPALISCGVVLSLNLPALNQLLVDQHCHNSLCATHAPVSDVLAIPAVLLLLYLVVGLGRCLREKVIPSWQLAHQFSAIASSSNAYSVLPTEEPAAFNLGWFKANIFLTKGLIAQCSPDEIQCIVEHEAAHFKRYDNLRQLTVWLLTAVLPKRWTSAMINDHQLLCEQACDRIAARRINALQVASTISHIARLSHVHPLGATAFGASHIEARISALVGDEPEFLGATALLLYAGMPVVLSAVLIMPLHHLLELFRLD